MKLSTKARYSVMAMVELGQSCEDVPMALSVISDKQHLPLPYLEQIFLKLKRNGLIRSVRGTHGGYILGRSARDISVHDIITSVEKAPRATRCGQTPMGCQPGKARCATHHLWENLENVIEDYLKKISLSDLTARQQPLKRGKD